MSSQEDGKAGLKKIFPCFLALFVGTMDFFIIYPFIAVLLAPGENSLIPDNMGLDLRHFYLGLAIFLNPFCKMLGNPFIGEMADRYGPRRVLMICLFSLALALLITGIGIHIHSLWLFLFGRVYAGFFSAVKPLTIAIISGSCIKEKQYTFISHLIAAAGLSYAVSPILGGLLSDKDLISWLAPDDAFFAAAILAFIVFFLCLRLPYVAPCGKTHKPVNILTPITSFVRAINHYHICIFTIGVIIADLGYSLFVASISYGYHHDMGATPFQTSILVGSLGFGYFIASAFIAPKLLKKFSALTICLFGCTITGILMIVIGASYTKLSMFILSPLVGFGNLFYFISFSVLFLHAVNKEARSWSLGIFMAGSALGFAGSGILMNFLDIGTSSDLIISAGVICILSGIVMKAFSNKHHCDDCQKMGEPVNKTGSKH